MDREARIKHYEEERRAFHKALQDVVREFENDGIIIGSVILMEIQTADSRYMLTRTFDVNGDGTKTWQTLGYLRAATLDTEAASVSNSYSPIDEDDDEGQDGTGSD